jgi:hypothetical protein
LSGDAESGVDRQGDAVHHRGTVRQQKQNDFSHFVGLYEAPKRHPRKRNPGSKSLQLFGIMRYIACTSKKNFDLCGTFSTSAHYGDTAGDPPTPHPMPAALLKPTEKGSAFSLAGVSAENV